eukprot:3941383-Rhodomonas_salina.3
MVLRAPYAKSGTDIGISLPGVEKEWREGEGERGREGGKARTRCVCYAYAYRRCLHTRISVLNIDFAAYAHTAVYAYVATRSLMPVLVLRRAYAGTV